MSAHIVRQVLGYERKSGSGWCNTGIDRLLWQDGDVFEQSINKADREATI